MKVIQRLILSILLISGLFSASEAHAYFLYSPDFCEFRITFPEAPTTNTLWTDDKHPHFLRDMTVDHRRIGEESIYQRQVPGTFDMSIRTTCLHISREKVPDISKEQLFTITKNYMKLHLPKLENRRRSYTPWGDSIKWGVISGYSFTESKIPVLHVVHVLTGEKSLFIVEGRLMGADEQQTELYEEITKSINIDFE